MSGDSKLYFVSDPISMGALYKDELQKAVRTAIKYGEEHQLVLKYKDVVPLLWKAYEVCQGRATDGERYDAGRKIIEYLVDIGETA